MRNNQGMDIDPSSVIFTPIGATRLGGLDFSLLRFSPTQLNPFEDPKIAGIWAPEFAAIGRQAYDEEREEIMAQPGGDFGEAFLLTAASPGEATQAAGVTGYFPFDDEGRLRILLRWHGAREDLRGLGASAWMVEQVRGRAAMAHPQCEHLVEHMPDIPPYAGIALAFSKMGFARTDAVHLHDWSPHPWREWELPLRPEPASKPARPGKPR